MCLGLPGRVVELVSDEFAFAVVDVAGEHTDVNVGLLTAEGGLRAGDWVLVHVGFAVRRLDDEEAADALRFLDELREAAA